MKIGIDSYCYHKFFGEVYPMEEAPKNPMSIEDFLNRAGELKVDGVSLETCFIPSFDESYLKKVKELIDKYNFDVVVAWGHPDGLEGGKYEPGVWEIIDQLKTCKILGTRVMRIVGSSLKYRYDPHEPQLKKIAKMMRKVVKLAEENGVKIAMENHLDFTIDEIADLVSKIDSTYFGVCFDAGNCLRNGDDPVYGVKTLNKSIYATHIKDVEPVYGCDPKEWYFFSSTPVGKGIINFPAVVNELKKVGYKGYLAVEIDNLHSKYNGEVDKAVVQSVEYLKNIAK
ncbi:MAG: sugar phosphate isomerase/epimerase family protein [Candidatus Humimicrobiaceae bacterium]